MKNKTGIAVAGVILVDKINNLTAYPKCGELAKIESISFSTGGCVPNVAIDLKKAMPSLDVKAIGKIGSDENGSYVLETLSKYDVECSMVNRCSQNTSFTEVMSVVGGQRTFFTYAGANSTFGYTDIDFENLNVKMLHLGYFLLLDKIDNGDGEKILKKAKELGIKTSIDLVTENSNRFSLVLPCLKYVDNLIINESEAGKLAGITPTNSNLVEIAVRLKELGVIERVIIHTPEISVCASNDGVTEFYSFDVPKCLIKGTTGAGDAFCAGALLGIYLDRSDRDVLEFASSVAVTALFESDAISGIKTLNEARKITSLLKRKTLK